MFNPKNCDGPCTSSIDVKSRTSDFNQVIRFHSQTSSSRIESHQFNPFCPIISPPNAEMSCCRVFLQRAPHSAIRPIPSLYRTPFRATNLNLTLTHKVVLLRAYSQTTGRPIKQTQSTTSAPRDQKPAAQSIYTRPEPNRKYGTALILTSPSTPPVSLTRVRFCQSSPKGSSFTTQEAAGSCI
jgi:hypothetical protein